MKLLDLSFEMTNDMIVYPGTPLPKFAPAYTVATDGYLETRFDMLSHTGTHIDAPAHMIENGMGLEQMPIDKFFGLALLIDVSEKRGQKIELSFLKCFAEKIKDAKFVVFRTGYQHLWGKDEYYHDYPILTEEAAQWLSQFDLNGIGMDTLSPDEANTSDFPIHKIFFAKDFIIVENLNNLDKLLDGISRIHGGYFLLSVMPLKYAKADGSPVRAIGYDVPEMIY